MPPYHIHDLLPLLVAGHYEQGFASAHDFWPVCLPIQFGRLNPPTALSWLNITEQQVGELAFFIGGGEEVGHVVIAFDAETKRR